MNSSHCHEDKRQLLHPRRAKRLWKISEKVNCMAKKQSKTKQKKRLTWRRYTLKKKGEGIQQGVQFLRVLAVLPCETFIIGLPLSSHTNPKRHAYTRKTPFFQIHTTFHINAVYRFGSQHPRRDFRVDSVLNLRSIHQTNTRNCGVCERDHHLVWKLNLKVTKLRQETNPCTTSKVTENGRDQSSQL